MTVLDLCDGWHRWRQRRFSGLAWSLGIAGVTLCCAPDSPALAQAGGIREYKHDSWTFEAGAPSEMIALAQSPDGYLWLAAKTGLYRFDGDTFEHVQHANPGQVSGGATAVLVARDRTIWAAFGGELYKYRNGKLHNAPGFRREIISSLAEGPDGAIWFRNANPKDPLYRYWRGRFEPIGLDWGVPRPWVRHILAARDGTIWLVTEGQILFFRPGSRLFVGMEEQVGLSGGLAEDREGNIWYAGTEGTRLLRSAGSPTTKPILSIHFPPVVERIRAINLISDRQNALWATTSSNGIFRIPHPLKLSVGKVAVDRFGRADGLSADVARAALEDREGNIWIGSQSGLDRFRATPVVMEQAIAPNPDGYFMARDAQGTVFVAADRTIYEISPYRAPRVVTTWRDSVDTLCASSDGSMWVSSAGAIGRLRGGKVEIVRGPGYSVRSYGCREDRERRLWFLSLEGRVVGRLPDGRWVEPIPAVPDFSATMDIALDANGHAIARWGTERVRVIEAQTVAAIPQAKLGVGPLLSIVEGQRDTFIMATNSFSRWRGGRIQKLDTKNDYPWLSMRGMVQTPQGETWMFGSNGILRMSTARLEYAFDHPGAAIPHQRFDGNDGLIGETQHIGYRGPQVARGADGRIWFLTTLGVMRLDPTDLRRNNLPPPVTIRSLVVDGKKYIDPTNVLLPAGTSNVEIDYTANSLTVPSRVRFRYKLEGLDKTWVDPGSRREAFYTNLGPGRYRFRVIATNNDGVWNRTGQRSRSRSPPTFFQTWWFVLICMFPVAALIWFLYTLRLKRVANQVRRQMQARITERERIARELHDTLLQSFQGVTFFFQSIVGQFPEGSKLRSTIEEGLDYADAALIEGRDRVRELRSSSDWHDLAEALRLIAPSVGTGAGPNFKVSAKGAPRPLVELVSEELQRICQEAVRNAVKHAHATSIEIDVNYGSRQLGLIISDDGAGLPDPILNGRSLAGHYGLVGMRERAQRIGARFDLARKSGGGTEIRISVPGRLCYQDRHFGMPMQLRLQKWRQRLSG